MGQKLFGVDISKEVAAAMPVGSMPAMILRRVTQGALVGGSLTRGVTQQSVATYTTRGIVEEFTKEGLRRSKDFQDGDKVIMMLAKPLQDSGVEPQKDDEVDVTENGTTERYNIINVIGRDPGGATWRLHCRG